MSNAKRITTLMALLAMGCLTVSAESILDRMRTRDIANWQYIDYYLHIFVTQYENYPFVVRTCIVILLVSCISIFCFTILLISQKIKDNRNNWYYNSLYNRYYAKLVEISSARENMDYQEVADRLGIAERQRQRLRKGSRMFVLGRLLMQVKSEYYDTYNQANIQQIVRAFGLREHMEHVFTFGSKTRRLRAMQLAQFLMIDVPESILVRLLNSSSTTLRKEVRMYYLWLCDYDPFRFFEDASYDYEYRPWDSLEIHHLLRARKRAGKEMPSLPPVVSVCPDDRLKACLIREVGFWGKPEEVERMEHFFHSNNIDIRMAAIDCMGIARSARAEHKLVELYPAQVKRVQLHTLKAIMQIKSGNAVGFLVRAWADCTVMSVKLNGTTATWAARSLPAWSTTPQARTAYCSARCAPLQVFIRRQRHERDTVLYLRLPGVLLLDGTDDKLRDTHAAGLP